MPRIALSPAEVAAAFEKILAQGEQPTPENIHALLGKGTLPLVQKYIRQISEQSRLELAPTESPAPAPEIPSPAAPEASSDLPPEPSQDSVTAVQNNNQSRRPFIRRERFTNRHTSAGAQSPQQNRGPVVEFEEVIETPLEQLSEEALAIKVRRLESILLKEQMRREMAERIMEETKDYADSIKEQVSQRLDDLRQNMDLVIEQLKNQLQAQRLGFDQDLKYYQEQLGKANQKIISLLK